MATPTDGFVTLFVSSVGRTVGTQVGLLAVEEIATTETVEGFPNANRLTELGPESPPLTPRYSCRGYGNTESQDD
ncbi:hypothetical protein CCHR01_05652 [Colletotrichum chrysophilum]|uniref:Uncharacterized protein n=1 Tax=Colletotrichum chrysophilum TaxID=1836956 RepID=A0AAD9AQM8_9PEZI|nr:hypothetical protein CCHR01_05652 [Colletotrichum chrysophilum]